MNRRSIIIHNSENTLFAVPRRIRSLRSIFGIVLGLVVIVAITGCNATAGGSTNKQQATSSVSVAGLLVTYRGNADGARSVAWSPDGKRIASSSDDNTVQVWQAA